MRARTALAICAVICLVALVASAVTSCEKGEDHAGHPLGLAISPGPDSRSSPDALVRLHRLPLGETPDRRLAGHQESAPTLEAAAAVVEPCGSRFPTDHDVLRVTWATNYFDVPWAITAILELEWCESCRRDNLAGQSKEQGRFQYLRSTWVRFQHEWMAVRLDPPPVDPLDAWDATLMTAFAISQGHADHWTCWGRW